MRIALEVLSAHYFNLLDADKFFFMRFTLDFQAQFYGFLHVFHEFVYSPALAVAASQ